jgi:hypothetical protein
MAPLIKRHGLNAISPYYTMFPLSFPLDCLRAARRGDWVLDPFCGRGTTNFAARLRGLNSIGIDVSPVAVAVAKAKFACASPEEVGNLAGRILRDRTARSVPEGEFWSLCFHPDTLRDICALRETLAQQCESDAEILLRALTAGILHGPKNIGAPTYLSNQMPRTYATKPEPAVKFWQRRQLAPGYVDVGDAIRRRAEFSLRRLPQRTAGVAVHENCLKTDFASFGATFNWVITSPPYFHMKSYVADQWLRAWFLGGPPYVDYSTRHQAGKGTPADFTRTLSTVWANISRACAHGAHLHVRLGSIPSSPSEPAEILKNSVLNSEVGWRIRSVRAAGHAGWGKRQATQFGRTLGGAVEEFDLHATLDG